jgi:uncharacterized protein
MNIQQKLRERLGARDKVLNHPSLRWLGTRLHDPNLWHFGRRAVAGGFGLGLLIMFFPLPIHMLIAPPLALFLRVNLPITLTVIWLSNPVTLVPILYLTYQVGCWVLGTPALATVFDGGFTFATIANAADKVWLPLCVGSLLCGVTAGLSGYFAVHGFWRWRIRQRQRRRRLRARS